MCAFSFRHLAFISYTRPTITHLDQRWQKQGPHEAVCLAYMGLCCVQSRHYYPFLAHYPYLLPILQILSISCPGILYQLINLTMWNETYLPLWSRHNSFLVVLLLICKTYVTGDWAKIMAEFFKNILGIEMGQFLYLPACINTKVQAWMKNETRLFQISWKRATGLCFIHLHNESSVFKDRCTIPKNWASTGYVFTGFNLFWAHTIWSALGWAPPYMMYIWIRFAFCLLDTNMNNSYLK